MRSGGGIVVPGYKHPCRYCGGLIPADSNMCPLCGKVNPLGPLRCPKCRNPIQRDWTNCSDCGISLITECPQCGEPTFFGDYCEHCDARLVVVCPNKRCKKEQPPIQETCIACGKSLKEVRPR
ncbi:MAG: zinc ribbon domain-containing protein [Coriobacteriia bacterium]|nr:zinc ribbon domain-containing protein [Coriobacteriia bacterium]